MTGSPRTAARSGGKRARGASKPKIGRYTLGPQLGKGGYGEVHVGVPKAGPRVAIKLLDATLTRDDEAVARFKREAETIQRLDHPNVVRLLEVGASRNRHFIAMELVHGGSLKALMRRAPDREHARKVLAALAGAARGLAYAHDQGIVHRDVKPSNILTTRAGKAKVADFGLARAIDQPSMTTDGKVLGTASYMSPEQARGQRATSAKSPREEFFYFDDDGNLVAVRVGNWKAVFLEQRARGTLALWGEPFTVLRIPKLFNLRTDPFERADVTSNTYWDWYINKAYMIMAAQAVVQRFLDTFKEFPPRQKAASFTIDQAMEKLQESFKRD